MRLGFHVSVAGGLLKSLKRATKLNCQTMQLFNGSPRTWDTLSLEKFDIQEFNKKRNALKIRPLFVHTSYLINLASPVEKDWEKAKKYFVEEIKFADEIGAEYLVTHLGNHKGEGIKFAEKRVSEVLRNSLSEIKNKSVNILLENTAGEGTSVGYKLSQISNIIDNIEKTERIGVCLDTAHAFSAGYKINTQKGWENFICELKRLKLFKKVKLIHLNDSIGALGSEIDRHQHIGKGEIGIEGFEVILNSSFITSKSVIMETPRDSIGDDVKNFNTVIKLLQ